VAAVAGSGDLPPIRYRRVTVAGHAAGVRRVLREPAASVAVAAAAADAFPHSVEAR